MPEHWPEAGPYRGRRVLVTGGFGFLGLNLVSRLHDAGASVRVLDLVWPRREGPFRSMLDSVRSQIGDLRDEHLVAKAVDGCEVIFNLAGKSGAAVSNASPLDDLDVNARGQLTLLEACRRFSPEAKLVFPSSRLVYRPTHDLPVPESAALDPLSVYGIHKLLVEYYHRLYERLHGMRCTILRITNPYGPFQRPEQTRYGVINLFIHLGVSGQELVVYGDGMQIRDYVHVDDVVRGFLLSGIDPRADGKILNIGGGEPVCFKDMALAIVRLAGSGSVRFAEWPADAALVETGDFVADLRLAEECIGWKPQVAFEAGLADVIRKYQSDE